MIRRAAWRSRDAARPQTQRSGDHRDPSTSKSGRTRTEAEGNSDIPRDGKCLWLVSMQKAAALAHGDVDRAFFNMPPRLRPVLGFSACFVARDGSAADWRLSRKTSKQPMQPTTKKTPLPTFTSKDGLVRILTTATPRRWPPHQFPVVVIRLTPCRGTRVLSRPDSSIEFMPRWSEVLALCSQMGLRISMAPSDKSEARRKMFEQINAGRHGRKTK